MIFVRQMMIVAWTVGPRRSLRGMGRRFMITACCVVVFMTMPSRTRGTECVARHLVMVAGPVIHLVPSTVRSVLPNVHSWSTMVLLEERVLEDKSVALAGVVAGEWWWWDCRVTVGKELGEVSLQVNETCFFLDFLGWRSMAGRAS